MTRFKDLRISFIFLITFISACESMKPDEVNVASFPEMDELLQNQPANPGAKNLAKEVWLDQKSEEQVFNMDTSKWKSELSFLKEINPNQPEYVGAFEVINGEDGKELILREGEKGPLKKLVFQHSDKNAILLQAVLHENKDVFVHHKEIDVHFSDGMISSYSINGYQKIMMKDTIRFQIRGRIIN